MKKVWFFIFLLFPVSVIAAERIVPIQNSMKSQIKIKGVKVLKLNEEVPVIQCEASPQGCACPAGSIRTTYFQQENKSKPVEQVMSCIPAQCGFGEVRRQKVDRKSGKVSYSCLKVKS